MPTPQEILNFLINSPKQDDSLQGKSPLKQQREDSIREIQEGRIPTGTNIELIVAAAMDEQERMATSPALAGSEDAITRSTQFTVESQNSMQRVIQELTASTKAMVDPTKEVINASADLSALQLVKDLGIDEKIKNILSGREVERDSVRTEINAKLEEIKRDTEVLNADSGINVIDFINNPLAYADILAKKGQAERRIANNSAMLQQLDGVESAQARMTQGAIADQQLIRTLTDRKNESAYVRELESVRLLKLAETGQKFTIEQFTNLKESLGLHTSALNSLASGLNALSEKGRLTQGRLDIALKGAQLKTAQIQVDQMAKMVERDENMNTVFSERIRLAAESHGVSDLIYDFTSFQGAVESGVAPPEVLGAISWAAAVGNLDTHAIFNAASPIQRASIFLGTDSSMLSEEIFQLTANVDSLVYAGNATTPTLAANWSTLSEKERDGVRDVALKQFYNNSKTDADLYLNNNLLALHSPNTLDYGPESGLEGIPPQVQDVLKGIRTETRNFRLYTKDLASSLADAALAGKLTTEQAAISAAMIMELHAKDLRNRTGLGGEGLRISRFGDTKTDEIVDTTNPVVWKNRLESVVAIKSALNRTHMYGAGLGPLL